jgi:acetolactate synthase-1/2/3 large subunit
MKRTGAEIIIELLEQEGIETIAGIPGGMNLPLYDALSRSRIRHVLARHEQAAGFIAQGMARATGRPAVCFATSGPGATNLLTAIADAKLDSIPVIAITGQVPRRLLGTDAFQEVDVYSMSLPVTKHNFLVRSAAELLTVIPEAFRIAAGGRPGPVLIDVPKDVQTEAVEFPAWPSRANRISATAISSKLIAAAATMINRAQRPFIYAGGGIIHGGAYGQLCSLARKNSIPVALTLMGLGCFPPDDPLYLGMLGMHGAAATNRIPAEADLVIALGVRFDDRATGDIAAFCPDAAVIHIDIDPAEINKLRKASLPITGDCGTVLEQLLPHITDNSRPAWRARIAEIKGQGTACPPDESDLMCPLGLINAVHRLAPHNAIITTDVGQHQMWVAQAYPFNNPRTLLTSGGLGTMGFGLPAAIGAALACLKQRIICISGDGSLLMNIQELATLADLGLDVTVIVMNNGHLGLVRQQQELFYGRRYIASKFTTCPDLSAIARGFGIRSCDLAEEDAPLSALQQALTEPGPCLVNAPIREDMNVFPMVPPGAANHDMIGG